MTAKKKAKKAENFKPKICAFCGKIFIPTSRPQKYCDAKCRTGKDQSEKKSIRNEYNKSIEASFEIDPYIPKENPNEDLVRIAAEARKAGMSYGQYVLRLRMPRRSKGE